MKVHRSHAAPPQVRPYFEDTHRPLHCLAFLLPLIVFYEVGTFLTSPDASMAQQERVVAFQMLRWFIGLFGTTSFFLPGLAVVAIFLAWHIASGQEWHVERSTVVGMAIESVVLAIPLLVLDRAVHLAGAHAGGLRDWLSQVVLSIGAGIYEELVFRLIFISLMLLLLVDVLGLPRNASLLVIIMLSGAVFSAHHHWPPANEPFALVPFLFRAAAGVYLAGVFALRGFGVAAGCHAAYDVIVVSAAWLRGG